MLRSLAFFPAALLVGSVPAVAAPQPVQQAQPQEQKQATATPAADPNRKICKIQDLIGSRTGGTRVCKTAAEWQRDRQANEDQD